MANRGVSFPRSSPSGSYEGFALLSDVKNRGRGAAVVGCEGAVEVTTAAGYGADAGVEQAIMVVRIAGVEKERFSPF